MRAHPVVFTDVYEPAFTCMWIVRIEEISKEPIVKKRCNPTGANCTIVCCQWTLLESYIALVIRWLELWWNKGTLMLICSNDGWCFPARQIVPEREVEVWEQPWSSWSADGSATCSHQNPGAKYIFKKWEYLNRLSDEYATLLIINQLCSVKLQILSSIGR